jgi:hypothetical protein
MPDSEIFSEEREIQMRASRNSEKRKNRSFTLILPLLLISISALSVPVSADTLDVILVTSERNVTTGVRTTVPVDDVTKADIRLFNTSAKSSSAMAEVTADKSMARFSRISSGEYLLQVMIEGFIIEKKKLAVSGDTKTTVELRRPIDFGNGDLPGKAPEYAGARYAFGCNSVSLIFAQWQGLNSWTDALRQISVNAATQGMNAFMSQAPESAHFVSHVENLGKYTVTKPVGDTCGLGMEWIREILTQMGYTTGTDTEKLNQLARARGNALCGSNPRCGSCGLNNSGFLFFIARENSGTNVGGWNCGGTYQISYFGNSDETGVYMHEIGHAFGTNDEYCTNLGGNNGFYCCGWPSGNFGCSNTGGCLNVANSNCAPACGQNCTPGSTFTDCQDGCPASNCTNHTPCVMDGGNSGIFCETSRRQMGWVDDDCDEALNCLETDCGTAPNNIGSFPAASDCPAQYSGIFVDSNAGTTQNGTSLYPFSTVLKAYNAATEGVDINIRPGTYPETLDMSKRLQLRKWGCGSAPVIGN